MKYMVTSGILMAVLLFFGLGNIDADETGKASVGYSEQLSPLAFMVGSFQGKGSHQWGAYDETIVGEWSNNRTIITIRSKSQMQGQVIYEDLRIFSYDNVANRLRMHQFAMGDLAVYDVKVEDQGKKLVLNETSHEGKAREQWRYTYTRQHEDEFSYVVDEKRGDTFTKYVAGSLTRTVAKTSELGVHKSERFSESIPAGDNKLAADIHRPVNQGNYPVVIFSPGSTAATTAGYEQFGQWFSSWGYVTVICAFNNNSAEVRARQFSAVAAWLNGESKRVDSKLCGIIDTKKIVAGGHSLGAYAAILAARTDERFTACLALAPSGPDKPVSGKTLPVSTCIIIGDADTYRKAAQAAHEDIGASSTLLVIKGMDHMLQPGACSLELISRATAFLEYKVRADGKYRTAFEVSSPLTTVHQNRKEGQ